MHALRRNPTLLAWNEFFGNFRFYYPVAVVYFEAVAGSYTAAMSVFSAIALATAFFEIPTGILSDRLGRRKTMVLASLTELAAITCFAGAGNMALLLVGGALYGLAQALLSGNSDALLYESMAFYRKRHRYPDVLGRVGSAAQMALLLASLGAAALLGAGLTLRFLVALSLVSVFLGLLTALAMTDPPPDKKRAPPPANAAGHVRAALCKMWGDASLRWLSCASILHYGIGFSSNNFLPGFVASVWPLWATGFLRALQHTLGAASSWFAGKIVTRFGSLRVLCTGMVAMNAIHIPAYLMANVFSPALICVSQAFYAPNTVARDTLLQSRFSDSERATMGSILSFGTQIAQAVFGVLIGLLADHAGPAAALVTAMLIRLPAALILWRLLHRPADAPAGKA